MYYKMSFLLYSYLFNQFTFNSVNHKNIPTEFENKLTEHRND